MLRGVPIDIGADDARQRAARELTDPGYHADDPGPLERAMDWVLRKLGQLFDGVEVPGINGFLGLAVLLVLVVLIVVIIRLRVGPLARTRRRGAEVFTGTRLSAADHRAAAENAAAAGDMNGAVRERFRAIVRELETRGVLDERSGRTVDEVAGEAGRLLPGCAAGLRDAAGTFDDVVYGDHPATEPAYRLIAELDDRVVREIPSAVLP
ncbi:DUF4129 domain-containing protein [Pseudonocardiaceae bacterium YIM PH 21723]|nr:DUF4129 domain-containing protein [Pseudonocardiaceae bacterium YIM PH 21723]